MITLVLGGARSGKSAVAEQRAARTGDAVTYVATAVTDPADLDHAARIAAHRARRSPTWTTLEVIGAELAPALARLPGTALVDSVGTWITGHGAAGLDVEALCRAITGRAGDTILVSEEVGLGVHPSSEAGRRFRDVLGETNVAIAQVADVVLLVIAGRVLPLERP